MKKLFTISAILFSIINLNAQVTYTSDNFTSIGDQYQKKSEVLSEGNTIPTEDVDPEMWDISSLEASNTSDIQIIGVEEFDELANLPEDCMLIEMTSGSYQIIQLIDETIYQLGIYALINGQHTPLLFNEPINIMEFPLTIGDTKAQEFKFETFGKPGDFGINEPSLDSMRFFTSFETTSEIVEEGILITPEGEYNAIKAFNTMQMDIDVWVKPLQSDWFLFQASMIVEKTKDYQYYTPEYGIPVASIEMNWNDEITSFDYMEEQESSIENVVTNNLTCYPNPVKSGSQLHFTSQINEVQIFDLAGRLVFSAKQTMNSIQIPQLAAGSYFVRVPETSKAMKLMVE